MSLIEIEIDKQIAINSLQSEEQIVEPTRWLDVGVSIAMLIFLMPLLLICALLVKVQDGGPVVFRQERIGKDGRLFTCFKFRSMVCHADKVLESLLASDEHARSEWLSDHKLRADPRITPVGWFLRKSSLDELPQLINVLRGDMCLVGPRPIIPSERVRYGRQFSAYCSVRPGITGLWQVSGRNDVSYRRRVAMDVLYSRSKSLTFDLFILLKTIPAVFSSKGTY